MTDPAAFSEKCVDELYFQLQGTWDRYQQDSKAPKATLLSPVLWASGAVVAGVALPLFVSKFHMNRVLPPSLQKLPVYVIRGLGFAPAIFLSFAGVVTFRRYRASEGARKRIEALHKERDKFFAKNDFVSLAWARDILKKEGDNFFNSLPNVINERVKEYFKGREEDFFFSAPVQVKISSLKQDQLNSNLFQDNPGLLKDYKNNHSKEEEQNYLSNLPKDRMVWIRQDKKGSELTDQEKKRFFGNSCKVSELHDWFNEKFEFPFKREEFVRVACEYYKASLKEASQNVYQDSALFYKGALGQADRVVKLPTNKESKILVFGDTHEDMVSLLTLLKSLKEQKLIGEDLVLTEEGTNTFIVQLGDRVDDGFHSASSEIIWHALAWKNPKNVILMRGNHEHFATGLHKGVNSRIGWPQENPLPKSLTPYQKLMWIQPVMTFLGGHTSTWQLISHGMPAEGVKMELFLDNYDARNAYITEYDRPDFVETVQKADPSLKIELSNPTILSPIPNHTSDSTYFGADFNWLDLKGEDISKNNFGHNNLQFSLKGLAALLQYIGGSAHTIDTSISGHGHKPCIASGGVQHLNVGSLNIWRVYSSACDPAITKDEEGAGYIKVSYDSEGVPNVQTHQLERHYTDFYKKLREGTLPSNKS